MYIIVGLGNPGKKYENTRHNAGFITVDKIADKFNIEIKKEKCKALLGMGEINDEKVILAKPQTYMNLSGEAVKAIMDFYKESVDNIIVIFDDIDLPPGNIRIKENGSAGTHNGVKSIVQMLNTQDFKRIKIGTGKPILKMDLADYVLGKFSEEEIEVIDNSTDDAVDATAMIVSGDLIKAMNKYN